MIDILMNTIHSYSLHHNNHYTAICNVLSSVLIIKTAHTIYCRRFGLSPFWFCRRLGLSPFWFVAVLVCRRLGLSPFWFVAV